jgi:hypothetical protein
MFWIGTEAQLDRAQIISDLASSGSIDALLARHPDLSREMVMRILDDAAVLLARDDQGLPPTSPLYRVYNGYMLGLFTAASFVIDVHDEQDRRKAVLHRISEFLLELASQFGKSVDLGNADSFEDAIEGHVGALDPELADYYRLGLATFRRVVLPERPEAADDQREAEELLQRLGHPPAFFAAMLDESGRRDASDDRTWQDMMTDCLYLARDMVANLGEESDTCFVALPFCEPYEQRYLNFYRNVAAQMSQRAIRAWGGLGQEEHQELLLALIAKSGALLGEVTEPNVNVALEIGFALGQNKTVYLVADQDSWNNAANVQLDWVFPYRTKGGEVLDGEEARAGLYLTTLKALRRPGLVPSWSARPLVVLQNLSQILQAT